MKTGMIKVYRISQGYAIIKQDDGGPDVFAHFTALDDVVRSRLMTGLPVMFEYFQDEKGLKASRVWIDIDFTWMDLPADLCGGNRHAVRDDRNGAVQVFPTKDLALKWVIERRENRIAIRPCQ